MCRFLLVSLNVDAILEGVTIGQRRSKLEEMARGNGLSDAYTATLNRLKAQNRNKSVLGLKVLMWVLNSERPLQANELCHALGVGIGSRDLNPENVPPLKVLLSSCLGLVMVEASSSTVRLVHFTLQEYLSSDSTLFTSPHSTIAEVCLTYLNFGCVRDISPDVYQAPSDIPFLEYASCYWSEHARREITENIRALALRLLDRFDEHVSAALLLVHFDADSEVLREFYYKKGPTKFSGLDGAASLGIVEIFAAVLEMKKWDVNAPDYSGSTALRWAAERGHDGVVKMLLEREDVDPDQADSNLGMTPLMWAAQNGHEGVVKLLLEGDGVNPDASNPDMENGTALLLAAKYGHMGVVKILLEREDVNPNQEFSYSGQPLVFWAAENGHEEILKMLLERKDFNPDVFDEYLGTLLCWVVKKGNEEALKILLKREDVNHNNPGGEWKPLHIAAMYGQGWAVKILLELEDIDPNYMDPDFGGTPLSLAAEEGHQEVAEMLLERKDVNPDYVGPMHGQTPLLLAANNGHEKVAKMLLDRKDVNPNQTDTRYGQTPLSWAAENGHVGIVKMLLERKDVNPDQADTFYGRTPLLWAATNGHEGVVRMLLERECVNLNRGDNIYGQTPLTWATKKGHEGVVNMLLERENVNPDQASAGFDRTLLPWWVEGGPDYWARQALERESINLDQAGAEHGRTPLSFAAEGGPVGILKRLLERKDVNPNQADTLFDGTPLSWAQCSQSSGAPVGPGGGTAKSPGRDGTAKRSSSSSFIPTCRAT